MSTPLVGFGSTMVGGEIALKRKILRKSCKTNCIKVPGTNTTFKSMAGPFRTFFSQGDPLNRKYQSCGGCNQVHDVNIRIRLNQDGISNSSCNVLTNNISPLQVPLESGNNKYVHDSSLFTRFKNLKSLKQNYNDISFGGNAHNGAYVSLMSVRR